MSDVGLAASLGPLRGPPSAGRLARWRAVLASVAFEDFCVGMLVAIGWGLGHTLVGIEGDARIYMGRALADLDPAGVGRDLMFALDGQSAFTVYRIIARDLVAALGLGPTVVVLSVLNLAVWFVSLAVFVRAIAPGRALGLVLAVACVLPRVYTPWNLLGAGEAIPVPRPLAEAGVLFAMAALCNGRFAVSALCLAGAALFHPIMAAAGFGAQLLVLGLRDRRWFVGAGLLGAAVAAAAALGVPGTSRLALTVDPEWLHLLRTRNPYLFLQSWPWSSAGRLVVQLVTIGLACYWLEKPIRRVFCASVAVALLGVAASCVLGDWLANLLVIQAQLWRALWLPAVLSTVAAGICLWRLPRCGLRGQVALPLLCLAWAALDAFPIAPLAACCALAAFLVAPRVQGLVAGKWIAVLWCVCAIFAAASIWASFTVIDTMGRGMPSGVHLEATKFWSLGLPIIPAILLFSAWWYFPDARATRFGAPLVTALAAFLLVLTWDMRTPAHRDADAATLKPELVAMLKPRPGPVLWIDGDDVWYWARRPNWNGQTQGGGIVFSRPLAMEWQSRAKRMLDDGLATRYLLSPWKYPIALTALPLDRDKILDFCRFADAPSWIVASLEPGTMPPADLGAQVWSPPEGHWKAYIRRDMVRWRHLDRYAVIPCARPER